MIKNLLSNRLKTILRKIVFMIAVRSDGFKRPILLIVGLAKYSEGSKNEARAYWRIAGFAGSARENIIDAKSEDYDEKYYKTMEDENYRTYIKSAKKLVLSTIPGKNDQICDIACGRGFLVRALQEEGYTKTVGIEISNYAAEHKVTDNVE